MNSSSLGWVALEGFGKAWHSHEPSAFGMGLVWVMLGWVELLAV